MSEFIDLIKSLLTNDDEGQIEELAESNLEWSEGKALVLSSDQDQTKIAGVLQESFKRGVLAALELAGEQSSSDVIDVEDEGGEVEDILDDDDDDDDDDNDDSDNINEALEAERDE